MYDNEIHTSEKSRYLNQSDQNVEKLTEQFKEEIDKWIHSHKRIKFTGLDQFPDRNVVLGVTHQIDDLHMQYKGRIAVFKGDYRYHWRLDPKVHCRTLQSLVYPDIVVLAVPFPGIADIHPETMEILERCRVFNIPVHIDAAWYGCCRNIELNCDHPAIKTVTFSLSKALGMGVHRIGLRYARKPQPGPVKIMNDFGYTNIADMWNGIQMMKKFGADFWWNKYENHYNKVCEDFKFKPSNAIHVAWDGKNLVGIRRLLRYLEEGSPGFV
jgi:hypothetical protein